MRKRLFRVFAGVILLLLVISLFVGVGATALNQNTYLPVVQSGVVPESTPPAPTADSSTPIPPTPVVATPPPTGP